MRYCSNCGNELKEGADVCLNCGKNHSNSVQNVRVIQNDSSSTGLWCLGFFIPLVGLILYLVWRDDKPLSAKSAGQGALISFLISVFFYFIYFFIILAAL
jgi:uncharacterized membrane protein YvbJ